MPPTKSNDVCALRRKSMLRIALSSVLGPTQGILALRSDLYASIEDVVEQSSGNVWHGRLLARLRSRKKHE